MASTVSDDLRLPDLRFVPTESLVPHEQHDEQRLQALVHRIRDQAVLKNPPVVAAISQNGQKGTRYMLLDGANRATAARAAGLPHIVVQVVRYGEPEVQLSTWYHALGQFPRADLESALGQVTGLEPRSAQRMNARALVARREALAFVTYEDGSATTLHGGHGIEERNALLNAVVDRYRDRGHFYRVTTDTVDQARVGHPDVTAVVVFPHFEPAEILDLATSGARLPAGITRHVIRWRALRLNVPLHRLADTDHTLDQKNQWLEDWIREKLSSRQVRFYEEPTVLFDE